MYKFIQVPLTSGAFAIDGRSSNSCNSFRHFTTGKHSTIMALDTRFMLVAALAVYIFGQAHGITKDETLNFGTTGMPERNTGLVGWVTVTKHPRDPVWIFESNGIPDHDTGDWPGANPNEIIEQSYKYVLPINPKVATQPTCLPGGPIGMATNGIPLFNPWNADSENAVEGPTQEV